VTVSSGEIAVTGTVNGAVTVNSGAPSPVLSGTGTINGTVTVGGTLNPGAQGYTVTPIYPVPASGNTGILTTGELIFQDNSSFATNINAGTPAAGATYDQVVVTTDPVTIGNSVPLTASGTFNGTNGQSIKLISSPDATPSITGAFSNLANSPTGSPITVNGNG